MDLSADGMVVRIVINPHDQPLDEARVGPFLAGLDGRLRDGLVTIQRVESVLRDGDENLCGKPESSYGDSA
jgi:hypothetical protein